MLCYESNVCLPTRNPGVANVARSPALSCVRACVFVPVIAVTVAGMESEGWSGMVMAVSAGRSRMREEPGREGRSSTRANTQQRETERERAQLSDEAYRAEHEQSEMLSVLHMLRYAGCLCYVLALVHMRRVRGRLRGGATRGTKT